MKKIIVFLCIITIPIVSIVINVELVRAILFSILLIPNLFIISNVVVLIYYIIKDKFLINKKSHNNTEYPTISILISAHNEEKTIYNTIKSLKKMEYENDFEIIAVAHNCTDNTYNEIKKIANVNAIKCDAGNTKGEALNYAVEFAKYEWILVIDADSLLPKDYLKVCANKILDDNLDALQTQVRLYNKNDNFLTKMSDLEFVINGNTKQYMFSKGKFALLGGNGQFVKKDVLIKAGYWTKSLADDTELSIRILKEGHYIGFTDKVSVYQEAVTDIKSFLVQRTRWCQGNTLLMFKVFGLGNIKSINLFFCLNGVLFSPFVKLSNLMFISNILLAPYISKYLLLMSLPYFLILTISLLKAEEKLYNVLVYYFYSLISYLVYFNTIYKLVQKDYSWNKTVHGVYKQLDNQLNIEQ